MVLGLLGAVSQIMPAPSRSSPAAQSCPAPMSVISEGVSCILKGIAQKLISDYLVTFHSMDSFPSPEQFLASTSNISQVLAKLGVLSQEWEELCSKMMDILRHVKHVQDAVHQQNILELDTELEKERTLLQELFSSKDVLESEESKRSATCLSLAAGMELLDVEMKQLSDKRYAIDLELRDGENRLSDIRMKKEEHQTLIQASQDRIISLERSQKEIKDGCSQVAITIKDQQLAFQQLAQEFLEKHS